MGLLDSPAIQKMFVEMLKQAAPDLLEHVDNFAGLVRDFKAQLDRIETEQVRVRNALNILLPIGDDNGETGQRKDGSASADA